MNGSKNGDFAKIVICKLQIENRKKGSKKLFRWEWWLDEKAQ